MEIYILKTDLNSIQEVKTIAPIFDLHPSIISWNVDTQDLDNVLRVESNQDLIEMELIALLKQYGVQSETLNY